MELQFILVNCGK